MKIALLNDYQNVALKCADWKRLPAGCEVIPFHDYLVDEDALVERLKDFQVVCIMRERTPIPGRLIKRLPNLKMVANTGMWNVALDIETCTEQGVLVCGTGGGSVPTMELTWGLIFAAMRQVHKEDAATRAGKWQTTLGIGLEGKTIGLIGLGRIGGGAAGVAKAFGMRVLAWSANLTDEKASEFQAERVELETLLRESDVVSIHYRLGDRSRGLLGKAELAMMKPGAFLINTARSQIVDEAALVEALRRGTIAGAGLDVFDQEPLPPDHPFLSLENVVLSPHVGYVTEEVYRSFYGESLENIEAFLAGAPIRVLNPEVLPKLEKPVP